MMREAVEYGMLEVSFPFTNANLSPACTCANRKDNENGLLFHTRIQYSYLDAGVFGNAAVLDLKHRHSNSVLIIAGIILRDEVYEAFQSS